MRPSKKACPSCRFLDHHATRRVSSLLLLSSVPLSLPPVSSSPNRHEDIAAILPHLSKSSFNFNPGFRPSPLAHLPRTLFTSCLLSVKTGTSFSSLPPFPSSTPAPSLTLPPLTSSLVQLSFSQPLSFCHIFTSHLILPSPSRCSPPLRLLRPSLRLTSLKPYSIWCDLPPPPYICLPSLVPLLREAERRKIQSGTREC